ncbi:LuxR C-terminal-related transcriptional regulator [Ferrovibrio terrae]|uniref:helix-turn-helix transcriptional regulator n=1 Tax=Ferrovibrio terrae TaxID=2594003 RepID=UPI003137FB29
MSARQRVLVASRNLDFAGALHREISRLPEWWLIGVVDSRVEDVFERTCTMVDVLLIDAEDLTWLWNNRNDATQKILESLRTVVILSDKQILDVVPRLPANSGLLFRTANGEVPVDVLEIALKGYVAIGQPLIDRLKRNQFRLDIVAGFSAEERRILAHIGNGLSNREIARATGLVENRVKTLVHLVTHKLRMGNRTAVAMFAASNQLAATNSD